MMYRFSCSVVLLCLLVGVLATPTPAAQAQDPANAQNNWLGMNLAGIADWSTEYPFADFFKSARPWISQRDGAEWGEGGPLALTSEGWVSQLQGGQFAETVLFSAEPTFNVGLDGQYVILYTGEGQLAFRGGNVTILSEEAGRMVVEAKPSAGAVFLQIVTTTPENPLREIRFVPADLESTYQTNPFNPLFLERIGPFTAVRFMDWMATNHSTIREWEERPLLSDATYAWRGVPVEVMIQLANTLQADAWFNMPHRASDAYVREFATLVRENLDPNLKAYVEYSNETWNGQFEQAAYMQDQGEALNLAAGDRFWSGLRYHGQRAGEMFAIWEDVFGGTDRLVRVIASQAANAWTGEQIADWIAQQGYQADALAIAPYFSCDDAGNPANTQAVLTAGLEALLDQQLANVGEGGCATQYMLDNLAVAQQFGLQLVAYEGGQHLSGYGGAENDEALATLFSEANRHPRMGEIYQAYLEQWQTVGGGLFMAFSDVTPNSKFGNWGALEYLNQDPASAPKYQALLEAISPQSSQ